VGGVIVHFSHPAEFVDELARDPHAVARKVVRVTQKAIPTKLGLTAVVVIATAKVLSEALGSDGGYDLVRLERFVGELWGHPSADEAVRSRAAELVGEVEARIAEADCDFVLAGGEYEVAES
jgi:hypothetical protein